MATIIIEELIINKGNKNEVLKLFHLACKLVGVENVEYQNCVFNF